MDQALRAAPGGLQHAEHDRRSTTPREAERRGFGKRSAADAAATVWAQNRARLGFADGGKTELLDENEAVRARLLGQRRAAHGRFQHTLDNWIATAKTCAGPSEPKAISTCTSATTAATMSEERCGLFRLQRSVELHCSIVEELAVALQVESQQSGTNDVNRLLAKFEQQHAAMVTEILEELRMAGR